MTIARTVDVFAVRPLSLPRSAGLLLVAMIPTLLTAVQPLVVDDPVYYSFAQYLGLHPLDPYGGGRMDVLMPPLLPYWGAATILLVGKSIPLAKLALYPFAALLTFGIDALARRFARDLAAVVVAMTVLSPWILPSFNYMLDVPAYGLGVAALALFVTGCERRAGGLIVLAGLIAGLAMQTKYNLATIPAAMLAYSLIVHRLRYGVVAGAVAIAFFVGVEAAIMVKYGESHFLHHLHGRAGLGKLGSLAYGLIGYCGGLGAALIPAGVLGLRARGGWIVAAIVICAAIVLAIGIGDDAWPAVLLDVHKTALPTVAHLSGLLGITLIAIVGRLVALLLASPDEDKRSARFLVVWLIIEIAGCFAISPWPAARRYIGVLLVATLIVCRAAADGMQAMPARRSFAVPIAALAIAGGAGCWAIGYVDAVNSRALSELAASRAKAMAGPDHRAWVWAVFGAGYYTAEAGLIPVESGRTVFAPGDVLVAIPGGLDMPKWDVSALPLIGSLSAGINLGATITPIYFAGKRPVSGASDTRPIALFYRARQPSRTPVAP